MFGKWLSGVEFLWALERILVTKSKNARLECEFLDVVSGFWPIGGFSVGGQPLGRHAFHKVNVSL